MQDNKQEIVAGRRRNDAAFVFDFSLQVKPGRDPDRPVFTGRFASGPVHDRFAYLAWRSVERGDYINRVKARLSAIDWTMVRKAQAADRQLIADMTAWRPGDPRKQVEWHLA